MQKHRHEERRRRRRHVDRAAARCSGSITSPRPPPPHPRRRLADYLDSGQSPVAGQWQHLAATYDGTTARYYIDGTQVASRAVTGGVGDSDTWRIGAYGSSPGGFFDGLIDDVRIYDRALSADRGPDRHEPAGAAEDTTPPTRPAR